ncbi:MAG: hypothetical protein KatS3mg110_2815 [Pirellulaceae bacterium]|nr:MAG: hypothetical protein KatS3mg110_2815 [Pirellulaceae bacterium]
MKQAARTRKSREWSNRLGRLKNSRFTVAEFCWQEQVSVATFYYWNRPARHLATQRTPEGHVMPNAARGNCEPGH